MTGNGRPLVPYLRQSRAKERTISIQEQRRDVRAWAEAAAAELAPEVVEQNVSGSKPRRERALGEAVDACEGGEASGIIVAWQDRLSRENGRATAEVWEALERAGARLVCTAEGLDTATGDHEDAVHDQGGEIGRDDFNGALLCWYGVDGDKGDADDEELWEAVNPASFVTVEALRKQRRSPSMSRSTFARLHLNAWVPAEAERWLETEAWERLADPETEIPEGATEYVGADGSRSYDTTAVCWASRDADGRIDVDGRVFSVRPGVPHHVPHEGTIDFADVEAFLLELLSRFDVAEVRFDPRYLQATMEAVQGRLSSQAVAPVEPYSQAHRLALQAFERAVLDGTARHRGDPALGEQLGWTAADRFENGDVRRLRKLDRSRPIDASVALGLAVQGAVLGEGGRSV